MSRSQRYFLLSECINQKSVRERWKGGGEDGGESGEGEDTAIPTTPPMFCKKLMEVVAVGTLFLGTLPCRMITQFWNENPIPIPTC